MCLSFILLFFFFNDTATTEIFTLSLHDALPISLVERKTGYLALGQLRQRSSAAVNPRAQQLIAAQPHSVRDRKSTRLNSSHGYISYAVFCLKKKKQRHNTSEAT